MEPRELLPDEVVQLNPQTVRNKMFSGCFIVVTEPKSFGCQGYVQALGKNGEPGGLAFYRPHWDEMEPLGVRAEWVKA